MSRKANREEQIAFSAYLKEFENWDADKFRSRSPKSKIESRFTKVEGGEAICQVAFYGSDVFLREMQTSKNASRGF